MKKMILCSFAVASVIGTYLLNESTTYESPCLLANVEALAFREDDSKGVGTILTHDLGKGTKCENGILYSVYKYSIDCFGEGTLPCQSGTYESFSPMGKCYEV